MLYSKKLDVIYSCYFNVSNILEYESTNDKSLIVFIFQGFGSARLILQLSVQQQTGGKIILVTIYLQY